MQTSRLTMFVLAVGSLLPTAYAQAVKTPGHHVTGMVTVASAGSYTVTSRRDPTPVTFTLTRKAHVYQMARARMADLQVGSPIRVNGAISADGTSISAKRITILAALPKHGHTAVTPGGKEIVGSITLLSPLKITTGDGTQVSVETSSLPQVMMRTEADPSQIAVGTRVTATLNAAGAAREVTIMPERQQRHRKGNVL